MTVAFNLEVRAVKSLADVILYVVGLNHLCILSLLRLKVLGQNATENRLKTAFLS